MQLGSTILWNFPTAKTDFVTIALVNNIRDASCVAGERTEEEDRVVPC